MFEANWLLVGHVRYEIFSRHLLIKQQGIIAGSVSGRCECLEHEHCQHKNLLSSNCSGGSIKTPKPSVFNQDENTSIVEEVEVSSSSEL